MVWQVVVPGTQSVTDMKGTSSSARPAASSSAGPKSTTRGVELFAVPLPLEPPVFEVSPPPVLFPPLPHAARKNAQQTTAASPIIRNVYFTLCPRAARRLVPLRERKLFP